MATGIGHNKTLILMAAKLWDLSKTLNKMAQKFQDYSTQVSDCEHTCM
jgi:hypothetical protein